jgi:3-phosphoshikimate 1-carboxyvinyltransferase
MKSKVTGVRHLTSTLRCVGKKNHSFKSFYKESTQGDSAIVKIYEEFFGIKTTFTEQEHKLTLEPIEGFQFPEKIVLDMNNCPDIAQTLCVTAAALKILLKFQDWKLCV